MYPKDTPFIVGLSSMWREIFFGYFGEDALPLEYQIHLMMKRLHQQYSEILAMPRKVRLSIATHEYKILKKEASDNSNEIGK